MRKNQKERNTWKSTFANRKWWPREFSFLLQVWFRIFFTENHIKWSIFKYFQRSSWFKHFIYTTLSDEFPTECHQHYMPSPASISTKFLFIKPSDQYLVECKPHNFLLHVVNPWRRSECQTGILFKLFCWKIYNLHFDFGHDKVIQNYMLTFR